MFSNFSCAQLELTRRAYSLLLWKLRNDEDFHSQERDINELTCLISRIDAELVRKCRVQAQVVQG